MQYNSQKTVRAIVVCCVQADLLGGFLRFITEDLGYEMGTFALICIPGGPTPLAYPDQMEKECRILDHQIQFCGTLYPAAELVLIAHKGCKYHERYALPHQEVSDTDHPKNDFPAIRNRYPLCRTHYVRQNLQIGRLEST